MSEVALMVSGPAEWYAGLRAALRQYGRTWLPQSEQLGADVQDLLLRALRGGRSASVIGCEPGAVRWRFRMTAKPVTGPDRTPPPDETAPAFCAAHDAGEGKCRDEADYQYRTWLPVVACDEVRQTALGDLLELHTKHPLTGPPGREQLFVVVPGRVPMQDDLRWMAVGGDTPRSAGEAAMVARVIAAHPARIEPGLVPAVDAVGAAVRAELPSTDLLFRDKMEDLVLLRVVGTRVTGEDVSLLLAEYFGPHGKLFARTDTRRILVGSGFAPEARKAAVQRCVCYDLWRTRTGVHIEFRDELP